MNSGDIVQLDSEIARLESELSSLQQKRIFVLEEALKEAKQAASGSRVAAPATRAAAAPAASPKSVATKAPRKVAKKRAGGKRTRMSSDEVRDRLISTVKAAGASGISLKGASDASGVNYQTAAKVLKEMSDVFVKKGELKDARYSLKK